MNSTDLISRKWLLENHKSHMGFLEVRRLIQEAPSVDAVEVVRCKDCFARNCWYKDDNGNDICWVSGMYIQSDSNFCSYGERRENNG